MRSLTHLSTSSTWHSNKVINHPLMHFGREQNKPRVAISQSSRLLDFSNSRFLDFSHSSHLAEPLLLWRQTLDGVGELFRCRDRLQQKWDREVVLVLDNARALRLEDIRRGDLADDEDERAELPRARDEVDARGAAAGELLEHARVEVAVPVEGHVGGRGEGEPHRRGLLRGNMPHDGPHGLVVVVRLDADGPFREPSRSPHGVAEALRGELLFKQLPVVVVHRVMSSSKKVSLAKLLH